MVQEIRIDSYFSMDTDLAGEMRGWPEFIAGEEYNVKLQDSASGETVFVRYVDMDDDPHVSVRGREGALFDRVLGRVIYALAGHSDNLMVTRYDRSR